MRCTFSDLTCKEVVNIVDGCRLGYVNDLTLNLKDGCILAIIVPQPGRWWGLFPSGIEHIIPFDRIVKIGDDIILVEFAPLSK